MNKKLIAGVIGLVALLAAAAPWRRGAVPPPPGSNLISTVQDPTDSVYGAVADDGLSDQTAFENAIAAACAETPVGSVRFPRGQYEFTRPLYLCGSLDFGCAAGQGQCYLHPMSGYNFHNLIIGRDHSPDDLDDGTMDQWTAALAGDAGMSFTQTTGGVVTHNYLDLTQEYQLRLPAAGWTMEFFLRLDDVPLDNSVIFQCVGSLFGGANADDEFGTEYTAAPQCMYLSVDSNRVLKWALRRDGTSSLPMTIATASLPTGALTVGDVYHVALEYNDTGDCMRAYINGERWTRDCQSPGASADSSGFFQRPWERIVLGDRSGGQAFIRAEGNNHTPTTIFSFHAQSGERYSAATFTPPTAAQTANANTLLLLNGDGFFKDNVIAKSGANGSVNSYLRMTAAASYETSSTYVHDLFLYGGMGMIGEFNSSSKMENVVGYSISDFLYYGQDNGYFSEFDNIDCVACNAARGGMAFNGGSYILLNNVQLAAGGIGLAANASNLTGNNVSITMHPGYFVGALFNGVSGTQIFNSLQMDAEEANSSELTALAVEHQDFTCNNCTLYLQDNTTTPVTINQVTGSGPLTAVFNSPYILTSAATPWIQMFGSDTTYDEPVIINHPYNSLGSPLVVSTKQGNIADSSKVRRQQVAGITSDNASVLVVPTDPVREADYIVSATTLVTAYTSGNSGAEVVYTDCGGTSRTLPLPGYTTAGASATVVTSATVLNGAEMKICADPATTITIQSVQSNTATLTIQGAVQKIGP